MERDAFNQLIGIFREEGRYYNEPSFFVGKITGCQSWYRNYSHYTSPKK